MFSSKWPKQKELNDMFVDFWSHVTFLDQFFLTSFLLVYCFPVSCFYRFCLVYMCFLCFFFAFTKFLLFLFLYTCFLRLELGRWVERLVGSGKSVWKENHGHNILHEKLFSVKYIKMCVLYKHHTFSSTCPEDPQDFWNIGLRRRQLLYQVLCAQGWMWSMWTSGQNGLNMSTNINGFFLEQRRGPSITCCLCLLDTK